ncbi:MAG TPA: M20 family metallopeptidase [Candidatus Limnocylindrales bacterium]
MIDAVEVSAAELQSLEHAVAGAEADYLADLERLCRIDCGSYSPRGVNKVATWVAEEMGRLGAEVDRRPDPEGRYGDTVVGTWHGTPEAGPRVLLIGHMDTVFEDGTAADRPFRIESGIAYGPGVTDMKGGLLTGLYAIRALRDVLGEDAPLPFERITYIANPDEEIGSPSSSPHIAEAARESDLCLCLECARANGDFVSARKGIADIRLTIHGRAAHAGVEPEKGRSAVLVGAQLTTAIHALNGQWPDVTTNVGVFKAGTRPNIVTDLAELQVDVRAKTAANLDAAIEAIRALAAKPAVPDVTVDVETMHSWRPMEKLQRSGRLVELTVELARGLGFATADTGTGGAGDANTTSGMGIPTIDGLGPVGGRDHSPDEYLEVASIVPRTALVAALLLAVSRDPICRGWR